MWGSKPLKSNKYAKVLFRCLKTESDNEAGREGVGGTISIDLRSGGLPPRSLEDFRENFVVVSSSQQCDPIGKK